MISFYTGNKDPSVRIGPAHSYLSIFLVHLPRVFDELVNCLEIDSDCSAFLFRSRPSGTPAPALGCIPVMVITESPLACIEESEERKEIEAKEEMKERDERKEREKEGKGEKEGKR